MFSYQDSTRRLVEDRHRKLRRDAARARVARRFRRSRGDLADHTDAARTR